MLSDEFGVPLCVACGCAGNMSCGHYPPEGGIGCGLDCRGVCPCCNAGLNDPEGDPCEAQKEGGHREGI